MIKLQRDRILVEVIGEERLSEIIMTPKEEDSNTYGIIHEVGPGELLKNGKTRRMLVKKGDKVIFSGFMGVKVHLEGKDFLIMKESDLMGIVED